MKTTLLPLLLLLSSTSAWAECRPWEIELSPGNLKGCGSDWALYKMRNIRVIFPDGFSVDRTPDGHGSCGQATNCDALTGFAYTVGGLTECWPQFDTPLRSDTIWSQTVHNQLAVPQLHQCSGSNFIAGPIVCREHPTAPARTSTVVHFCPTTTGGGGVGHPPFYNPNPVYPCSYLPGPMQPCYDPYDRQPTYGPPLPWPYYH